jgi:hypothetical protein
MKGKTPEEKAIIREFVKLLTEDAKDKNDLCPKWYVIDVMNEFLKTDRGDPMVFAGDVWRSFKQHKFEWTVDAFRLFDDFLAKKHNHTRW